jgi:RNA polymerase sigma-70 factor (ECF subfamily)
VEGRPEQQGCTSRWQAEASLIERVRAGDQDAEAELLALYLPRLEIFVHSRIPEDSRSLLDTQDVLQETMMRALSRLRVMSSDGVRLWPYLRKIALNFVRDLYEHASQRPTRERLKDGSGSSPADPRALPASQWMDKEEFERFERALAHLEQSIAEAVLLRFEVGCSFGEIADRCGYPSADAARMAVARAVGRLTKELADVE